MPIYMDRHNIPEDITAEHVAQMHQQDLKVQHLYGCKGMTYWCDESRNTAFCLIEAPNKKALQDMHNHAHGEVPHSIIEVNKTLVESFLGRIEDPKKPTDLELNIITDSAFRVIMVLETSNYLNRLEANQFTIFTQKFHNSVANTFNKFNGRIVKKDNNNYLVSFKDVSDAVLCALKIQFQFKYVTPKFDPASRRLKMALASGTPVTEKKHMFEKTISLARRMCEVVKDGLVITSEVKSLYESENNKAIINKELIKTISPDEEKFLTQLLDLLENIWFKPDINVVHFSKALGYSKSQLYRKLKQLTGQSPNSLLREFRLHNALKLLHHQKGNISEIAFETGFNSPAYFSKCFEEKYGLLPSKYLQQHIN